MPRGGYREKAGRKSTWKSGCSFSETKLIRVPTKIADKVLEFAHKLDSEGVIDLVTKSNTVSVVEEEPSTVQTEANPDQLSLFDAVLPPQAQCQDAEAPLSLSGRALAKRLNRSSGTLQERKKKNSPSVFATWTKALDPDHKAWRYDPKTEKYHEIQ